MNLFVNNNIVERFFKDKSVAIVGSGPGCLDNDRGFINSFDTVVRVNNYKLNSRTGNRTDVYYSFFGSSIKKNINDLKMDGVQLCIAKCPDARFMESEWHTRNNKELGIDFRYIYERRKNWWFTDTYVPTLEEFLATFHLLGWHIPTTGFSAILKVLENSPKKVYLTGFDFFESRIHNTNEPWKKINNDDPIGHRPDLEKLWLQDNMHLYNIIVDNQLARSLNGDL